MNNNDTNTTITSEKTETDNNKKLSREDKTLANIFEAIDLEARTVSPREKRKQKIIRFLSSKYLSITVWIILALIMAVLISHLFVLISSI